MIATILFVLAVGVYVALAAATDLRTHRIPNTLTVPAAVCGLGFHALAPTGWGPGVSLAGFGVGFALLLLPWLVGGGGMGDVKLLAALGAWLGSQYLLAAFGTAAMVAALWVLGTVVFQPSKAGAAAGPRLSVPQLPHRLRRQRPARGLPFAVPMAVGTYIVLAWLIVHGGIMG